MLNQIPGEAIALFIAAIWACASVLYSKAGKNIPAMELNLIKGVIAIVLVLLVLVIQGSLVTAVPAIAIVLLMVSGAVGIGLGDTAYLDALQSIGPRKTTLIKTIAPPTAGLIAWIFLGEKITALDWLGIAIIVAGVAWVITESPNGNGSLPLNRRGIIMAVIAALTEAAAVVLARSALTLTHISPLWSTFLRLAGGVVIILITLVIRQKPILQWIKQPGAGKTALTASGAIFLGTFMGIWLQQIVLTTTPAGIAQTLFATTPLFILPLAALMGEKVSLRAIFGALIAIAGMVILFII